jgi:hypothetical protein|tara:strand:+ start:238 stop:354 length:117 start_codon:yes stop_codon:yes gene_type:complete
MYWSAVAAAVVDIFMVVLVVLVVIELALFQLLDHQLKQ